MKKERYRKYLSYMSNGCQTRAW